MAGVQEAYLFAALVESLLRQGCAERFRLSALYLPTLRLAELVPGNMSAEAGRAEHTVTSFVVTWHHRSACAPTL